MSQIFTVVNDEVMVDAIKNARSKIVYVSPGISKAVAVALGARFVDLGKLAITIIVDVDPEVYRMGYGDTEGLDHIKRLSDRNLLELRHQPGVRIGLLVADDLTLVYSPTPHLIEAGSNQQEKPNAIVISSADDSIENACGCTPDSLLSNAEIGKDVVRSEVLEAVKKDLEETPPKQFNVARIERTFNSTIQYVEFKINKYRLSKKTASIPTDLLGLQDNQEIQNRWRNTFKIFDGSNKIQVQIPVRDDKGKVKKNDHGKEITIPYDEGSLEIERKKIESDYLYKVPGFDVVIFRSRRDAFDKTIKAFKERLADYQENLEKEVETSINATIENLATTILPLVKKHTPPRYLKSSGDNINDAELSKVIESDLREHFDDAKQISSPEITIKYKEISYETIHNPNFRAALERSKIPGHRVSNLFTEHDSAPETHDINE